MRHEESKLQQQCVAWFRAQYPQYAMLLTHVPNEGNGNRVSGAIHKAEGTVAGVPDLLLFMPAEYLQPNDKYKIMLNKLIHGLGVEFKTKTGKQSQQQKDFQKIFEAAGYRYIIVRSFDEFKKSINDYIAHVYPERRKMIASAHVEIVKAQNERELEHFKKVIGKR